MSNGYYVTSSGSTYYQGSYAYILRSDYSMSYAFIDEGTLTISYEGDNITVELEAKDLGATEYTQSIRALRFCKSSSRASVPTRR